LLPLVLLLLLVVPARLDDPRVAIFFPENEVDAFVESNARSIVIISLP
jgi:hypothetical protein